MSARAERWTSAPTASILGTEPHAPARPARLLREALLALGTGVVLRRLCGVDAAVRAAGSQLNVRDSAASSVVGEVAWAVLMLSRLPGVRCLDGALVARRLLARRGIGSDFLLGVRALGGTHLEAHAWLRLADAEAIDVGERLGYLPIRCWQAPNA